MSTKPSREDEIIRLFKLYHQIGQTLFKSVQSVHSDEGMGPSTVMLLRFLKETGQCTQRGLAKELYVSDAAVSRHISNLTARGLVESRVNPGDRRQLLVGLTAAGTELLETSKVAVTKRLMNLLEPLTDDEVAQLIESNILLQQTIAAQPKGD